MDTYLSEKSFHHDGRHLAFIHQDLLGFFGAVGLQERVKDCDYHFGKSSVDEHVHQDVEEGHVQ